MAEETSKRIVTVQGYMSVESKALDDAFVDTDVDPRQRLVSLEIDYLDDAIDVARCTFVDPDGRVGRAIRVGSTKIGDKLVYTPWTARIGYFGQEPEEMTSLTGVPMIEASNFPEDGEPVVTIKILPSSIALQKNLTPTGGVEEWIGPNGVDDPLKQAITDIALYYGLGDVNFGTSGLEGVIDRIDRIITDRVDLQHLDAAIADSYQLQESMNQMPETTINETWMRNPGSDKNDAKYLTRIAGIITSILESAILDVEFGYAAYFPGDLMGHPSKSDIKVLWGIYDNKLIFMFRRDYLKLIGLNRIPCLDYRVGNNLLRSFNPRTEATKAQGGLLSRIFASIRGEEDTTIDATAPEIKPEGSGAPDINALLVDKYIVGGATLPDNSIASGGLNMDMIRRSLNTDIKGEAATYGDKHLIAGNLVCLNGLPYGPMTEPKENEAQVFASYNRLYLIKQATHRMDDTGFYSAKLKVEGCSMDGSDETALADLMKRLEAGIEGGVGKSGFWDFLN